MAKKKVHPSQLRYGTVTSDQLKDSVSKINELAAVMTEVAGEMDRRKMTELRMDGVTKFDRGMDILSGYVEHLMIGMTKARFSKD